MSLHDTTALTDIGEGETATMPPTDYAGLPHRQEGLSTLPTYSGPHQRCPTRPTMLAHCVTATFSKKISRNMFYHKMAFTEPMLFSCTAMTMFIHNKDKKVRYRRHTALQRGKLWQKQAYRPKCGAKSVHLTSLYGAKDVWKC